MKEDAPPPKHPPRKRYQLENQSKTPDLWLAVWANDPDLDEEERERAQSERHRRKALQPDDVVGLLVDRENITPLQRDVLSKNFEEKRPTELHLPWASARVVHMCRRTGVPTVSHRELREVVVASQRILAAPRGQSSPAWEAVSYAKHRKLPITVVLPDGSIMS